MEPSQKHSNCGNNVAITIRVLNGSCNSKQAYDNTTDPDLEETNRLTKRLEGSQNAGMAEAATVHEGIKLEIDMGWTHANVEGDAMDIIIKLANHILDLSTIGVKLERDR
ncbi:hypothetical protein V6N12_033807 [Hibiscus sabdariffa]